MILAKLQTVQSGNWVDARTVIFDKMGNNC